MEKSHGPHALTLTCEEVALVMSGLVAFERWIDTAPIGLQDVEKKVVALKDKIMKQAHPESFTGLRAVQSEDVQ